MIKIDYKKLCEIMMWEQYDGESFEDTFLRQEIKTHELPPKLLIDVVHAEGVEGWSKINSFKSIEDLQAQIIHIFKTAIVHEINDNKDMQKLFPPIHNFCIYANRLDRNGRVKAEAIKASESAWYGEIAKITLKKKTDAIFNVKPEIEKYNEAAKELQYVYGFSLIEIDAFRYFICQSRHGNHSPSLNKSIYLSSDMKKTGKTSVARAIASVLNGGSSVLDGSRYESTFNKELQINDHDLPLAAQYNCVILDEMMPRDSRKSYGRVKSMLTSNTCSYNQKYGQIINLYAKRYYIFTSNDGVGEFIQDSSERRFIEVKMDKIPNQISFEKIYELWKKFAQNCTPEQDWQEWYNSFADVDGMQRDDIDNFKAEIISMPTVLDALKTHLRPHEGKGYYVSLKFFSDILITGKAISDEKKSLRKTLIELFGEPNSRKWSTKQVIEIIEKAKYDDEKNNKISQDESEKLPF